VTTLQEEFMLSMDCPLHLNGSRVVTKQRADLFTFGSLQYVSVHTFIILTGYKDTTVQLTPVSKHHK
jgi:hypothetical protein